MGRYTTGSVGRDMLAGAAAGIAAIWVANKLEQAMARSSGPEAIRDTEAARPGGMDPAHVLAKRATDAVGVDVGDPKDNPVGHTIHYGIAAGMGALYGLLRGMSPAVSTGRGAMFGLALFILKDEIGGPAMGVANNPLKYPLRDHGRGAASHTLFGVVTDLGVRLMSPWRDEVVILQGPPLSERLDRGRAYLDQTRGQLYEQGRQGLDRGRQYLDQGIDYARRASEQARARLPDPDDLARRGRSYADQVTKTVRTRLPDYDDAAALARDGRKRANRFASNLRSQLPDVDTAGLAKSGRRYANQAAGTARAYIEEVPTSGISRALQRLFG